jgi:hypothetical protein
MVTASPRSRLGMARWANLGLPCLLLLVGPALPHVAPLPGQDSGTAAWAAWVGSLDPDRRASAEILRYGVGGHPTLDPEEARLLSLRVMEELTTSAQAAVTRLRPSACEPSVLVRFGAEALPPAASPPSRTLQSLEAGLVRVESVACFRIPGVTPGEVLDLLVSPGFRMEVEGRIRAIWEEGDDSCVETAGIPALLAASRSCNRIRRWEGGAVASEHAQVVRNLDPGSSQVVYLKESLKTTVAIPGGIALHYVHLSRTADLGPTRRWAVERSIRDAEERKVAGLERALELRATRGGSALRPSS